MDDLAKVMQARDGESLEQLGERFKHWRETRGGASTSLEICGWRR